MGILYYAIYNPFSGRRGKFKNRQRLEVYRLNAGKYELLTIENNRVWLPEINLALGYENGEYIAWYREWLYWYDASGDRYLTANERAIKSEVIANQERSIATQERLARECRVFCVKSGIYTERQSRHTITNTKTDEYTQRIAR